MSSWHPHDLVNDQDLADYESAILTNFGALDWKARRSKALEDWLFPILRQNGLDPHRLRTRREADKVWAYTASAYSDKTTAARDTTTDDLNLAAIFATAASDLLYVGSTVPFRGLYWALNDTPSTATSTMTVAYWSGTWTTLTIADGTRVTSGKTLSAGGSVTWTLPVDWATRAINSTGPRYWARVSLSATPTSGLANQLAVILRSALCAPATFRTLELIFREAPTGQDGPWREKAEYYARQAEEALQRALPIVGGEFDTDASEQVSEDEADQTLEEAGSGGWRLERG